MTNEERIKANADKGYILVASFDGWDIYKKENEVGGYTYYSDQIGCEGAYPIWDTAVRSIEELSTLVKDLYPPLAMGGLEIKLYIFSFLKFKEEYQKQERERYRAEVKRVGGLFTYLGASDEDIYNDWEMQVTSGTIKLDQPKTKP